MENNKKGRSPLSRTLKKRRRERLARELKDGLLEVALELTFFLVCFAVGLGVLALFGMETPEDAEGVALIGMLILTLISLLVVGLLQLFKRKRAASPDRQAEGNAPHSYPSLQALYDDLCAAVDGVRLEDFEIKIDYGGECFSLRQKKNHYYYALINGEVQGGVLAGNEAYRLALEFAHDKRCDGGEVSISDSSIYCAESGVIRYRDYFDRSHDVNLIECVDTMGEGYVGRTDTSRGSIELFLVGYTLKITFDDLYKGKKHRLSGWKGQRIRKLKENISRGGYRLYENAAD